MHVTSPVFGDGEPIPARFAYRGVPGGRNISVPVHWDDIPPGTESFALSLVDPHPVARNWVHWLIVNIPVKTHSLDEGASGTRALLPSKELQNTYGTMGYGGPQPPKHSGVHPYVLTIYALNTPRVDLPANTTLENFLAVIGEKTIESAAITGTFEQ